MSIFVNILIFLHIFGLVVGMGSGVVASRVMPMTATADESQRGILFKVAEMLSKNGHIGLGVLWVTGLLAVWLKYGGVSDFSPWFWAKMVFVVVLSASVGIGGAAGKKLRAGDMSQAPRAKMAGMVSGISGLGAIFCAVFAFG